MKVSWKPREDDTEGSTIVLGDDSLGFRAAGSKFIIEAGPTSEQWLNQSVARPGAAEIKTFDRKNKQTAYVVIVDYQFSSLGASQKFRHAIGNDMSGGGVLEISHDGGGQDSLEAVLTGIDLVSGHGLNLVLRYTFLGGAFFKGPASNQVPIL